MRFTDFFKRGPSGKINPHPKINLHPENAEPYSYYKAIEVNRVCRYQTSLWGLRKIKYEVINSLGYIDNFMKTGEPGIIVHGGLDGKLGFIDGIKPHINAGDYAEIKHLNSIKKNLTPLEFYYHLKYKLSIDLSRDKRPLHLVCCHSEHVYSHRGISVAQELSNIAQRPMWSYGLHGKVIYRAHLRGLYDIIHGVGTFIDNSRVEIKPKMILPNRNGVI
ncbi:hypothetical protein ACLMPM_21820 [Yersinia enterocolitica]|uniref:hypothetical protein n=1 Tax=Yersinia enterocolitica TaxID=630 RepID=UPI00398D01AD